MSKLLKYMRVAEAVAELSKDKSTKVGALILGPANEIRACGYNGAPRGCEADEDERSERPEKYHWFSHAELNAITNAARVGTPLEGNTLVVTHFPCMDCARAIVQAGKLLDVEVLDHLVIGQGKWVSLKERGLGFA